MFRRNENDLPVKFIFTLRNMRRNVRIARNVAAHKVAYLKLSYYHGWFPERDAFGGMYRRN